MCGKKDITGETAETKAGDPAEKPAENPMALKAGFQIYLPKPVDPTELVAVVRALSQRRAGTAQP